MKKHNGFVKKLVAFVLLSALVITMSRPVFSYAQEEPEDTEQTQDSGEQNLLQLADEGEPQDNSQYDIDKPVIERIELSKQGETVKEGETVKLYIYAYDTGSGIEDIDVNAQYQGGYSVSGAISYDKEKECYVWEYQLQNISGNKLVVNSITVTDKVGNQATRTIFENGEYTVWAEVEWQQPEAEEVHITNFQFKQNGQRVSETDHLEISVETDKAFDRSDMFVTFQNEKSQITIFLRADESGRVFQNNEYTMGYNEPQGKWTLCDIYVMNFPNRPVKLYTDQIDKSDYSFDLKKTLNTDITEDMGEAPEITQMELEKNGEVLEAGDQVSIKVYASDKQALQEVGTVDFRAVSGINETLKTVNLIYNKEAGVYEGILSITDEMYPCEWYVDTISIYNTSGKRADDSSYTSGADYPYYLLVKNGITHVSPTYDLYVTFHMLDADGEWKEVGEAHQEKVERRQTLREAGITFPEMNGEYPGFTQIGWVDSEGNEITEDSECISTSGIKMVYAKYDKKLIDVSYQSVTAEGNCCSDSRKMVIPRNKTFGELKKEIESAAPPEGAYQGIKFQRWCLDSTEEYKEDQPLPDKTKFSFSVKALYDKNVLTVF